MTDRFIDIRPGVGVLGVFPNINYKPWYALGEFVDNAIQSYRANKKALREADGPGYRLGVQIELDSGGRGELIVRDNAAGIPWSRFPQAFVAAEPPPDPTGLSQFGMGMKSAACWFAARWEVRTKALGEDVERRIRFDVPKITKDKINQLSWKEAPAPRGTHFTEVRLWDLYQFPVGRTVGKMKDHLESIYRNFLRSHEIELRFRGESLGFEDPEVLLAPLATKPSGPPILWHKQIEIEFDRNKSIAGFAALRKKGSTAKAGFALFRKQRLILGSDDEAWRPAEVFGASNTFRYQRLFGEFEVTGIDVVYTKDGFLFGDLEEELLQRLAAELDAEPLALLRQAEQYRTREPAAKPGAAAQAVASTAAALDASAGQIAAQLSKASTDVPPDAVPTEAATIASKTVAVLVGNQEWRITVELSTDPAVTDWYTLFDSDPPRRPGDPRLVTIRVALTHPFTSQFGGTTATQLEPLVRIAAGLAIAEITARAENVARAGTIRRNLNELLRGPLATPSTFLESGT